MDRQAVRQISEADWKLFRQLSALALERFCEGVLSEVGRLASGKCAAGTAIAKYRRRRKLVSLSHPDNSAGS
jgi:hypothetical protein